MMGSNDSKPENWVDAETFRADLLSLLDSFGDAQIVLCTSPAAFFLEGQTEGVTNHDIQPLIMEEIAQITREVATERGYITKFFSREGETVEETRARLSRK